MPNLLTVRGLAKSYGPRTVLDAVSFAVRPGEVLGLIGPNGAGKTTLFECLAGLLPADAGEVHVPDGIGPWPDQPAGRVLRFFSDLWSAPPGRAAALAGALALDSLLAAPVRSLSKGERKRFLIALALLAPHPLLMLDEPFDGLDHRQTREATAVLRAEAARGRTLFLSIHQLADAGRACDRFVLLAGGRVVGEGTLADLRARAGMAEGGENGAGMEEVFLALT
jgi:ABC-type multidrug transport system ATPase subunit